MGHTVLFSVGFKNKGYFFNYTLLRTTRGPKGKISNSFRSDLKRLIRIIY